MRRWAGLFATGATLLFLQNAMAQDLVIGSKLDPSSLDPHYFNSADTVHPQSNIFESLIAQDLDGKLVSNLAVSWRSLDDKTWEIKLRPGVTFHNGKPFTADDVVFTFGRIPQVKSPGPFTVYTKQITKIDVIDPLTLHLKTEAPHPFLPQDIAQVFIVSRAAGEGMDTPDYNSGKATIGTGPYKLVEWVPNGKLTLAAYDGYWGAKPAWKKVEVRPIKTDPARVAALLAGDVDLIDLVPVTDLASLKRNDKLAVFQRPAARIMYAQMDSDREISPHAKGKDGKNPLRDPKVRKALSMAIDRAGLVRAVLEGAGAPASHMASPGTVGFNPAMEVEKYDPAGAKKLLAEAGYPDGFQLTVHGTSDRYPNGDKVAQALAQFFARVGIDAKVELVPNALFFPQASKLEYSFFFAGFGSVDPSVYLRTVLHSFDSVKLWGSSNRGRYKAADVDALIEKALATLDDKARATMMAEAFALAEGRDQAVISIYYPTYDFAGRKDKVVYTPDADGRMNAILAKPAK